MTQDKHDSEHLVARIRGTEPLFWLNPQYDSTRKISAASKLTQADIEDARLRLERFAPYIAKVFPETAKSHGKIESPLIKANTIGKTLSSTEGPRGEIYIKLDSHLPISGSIKARGGIYEVLKFAEKIALEKGMLSLEDNYTCFNSPDFYNLFSKYSLMVGSTGNLGLSIGIMGACLGFKTSVHMSSDAKAWKKDLLREKGVTVIEYDSDYSVAVTEGRKIADTDPLCHFVDDENSHDLFLGYSVAAKRVAKQLADQGVLIDQHHPLCVYLPCGVGGGPGGVAFGLKQIFGDAVHCFFAEPTHSPAMLLGLATGLYEGIASTDLGIVNRTIADGLAVGRPSGLVARIMESLLAGCFTVDDEELYRLIARVFDAENLSLEPSAVAGFAGIIPCEKHCAQLSILQPENIRHLVWATGGSMVPQSIWQKDYQQGCKLI